MQKTDLCSLDLTELEAFLKELGEPKYRAGQVFRWIARGARDFSEMTNLSKPLREKLSESAYLSTPAIAEKRVSKLDGTTKYLFRLQDGRYIESVVMFYHYGASICISTQVGCKMGCSFCASSYLGFERNLSAGELLTQVTAAQADLKERISRVVLMGIGEPLDNFENVIKFLGLIGDARGVNLGMRHISLSTCGLVNQITMLMEKRLPITLCISLHAPNDAIRQKLMPIATRVSMENLLSTCRAYAEKTGRRITFEYALIDGVNDAPEHARELAGKLSHMLCHVNLIPLNHVDESGLGQASQEKAFAFQKILEHRSIETTIRREMGADIQAACGQLRKGKFESDAVIIGRDSE